MRVEIHLNLQNMIITQVIQIFQHQQMILLNAWTDYCQKKTETKAKRTKSQKDGQWKRSMQSQLLVLCNGIDSWY